MIDRLVRLNSIIKEILICECLDCNAKNALTNLIIFKVGNFQTHIKYTLTFSRYAFDF